MAKSNLLPVILFLFFFTISSYWLSSSAASDSSQQLRAQASTFPGDFRNGGRRWIAEVKGDNSSFVLAERRTSRQDPSNGFKLYNGGWNISNEHYWASVAFTAATFFVIAAVCTGCAFLYTGQAKFQTSTGSTLEYVVGQADATGRNLTSVSSYLDTAKTLGVDQLTLTENILNKINKIQSKIDSASSTLTTKTHDNSRKIKRALDIVRTVLVVIAAVMLVLAFIGFLLSIFGFQCLVYTLVIFGWILVSATFVICGVFLVLHNVVADTCVAMDDWVQHPTAHTALDDILPCVENTTAEDILQQSKDINRQLVDLLDTAIVNISNVNSSPNDTFAYYNQSGPLLPVLCKPYNSDLTDRSCTQGEVNYNNAIEVWKNYVCQVSANNNRMCITTGRLTPTFYEQLVKATNVSYGLYTYTPFLVNLADCTFVRSTFSDISKNNCPGLQKYTQWIYIGLVMVSAAVMFSLIFWVIYARERRHRVYTKLVTGSG